MIRSHCESSGIFLLLHFQRWFLSTVKVHTKNIVRAKKQWASWLRRTLVQIRSVELLLKRV